MVRPKSIFNILTFPQASVWKGRAIIAYWISRKQAHGGQMPYPGNILVADSKGYVKALYFRGD